MRWNVTMSNGRKLIVYADPADPNNLGTSELGQRLRDCEVVAGVSVDEVAIAHPLDHDAKGVYERMLDDRRAPGS